MIGPKVDGQNVLSMYFVFYIVDGWSVVKLTGLRARSWAALETYVGGLGVLLGPMLAVLGRSWGLCVRSWAALGAYLGGLGPLLGLMLAMLCRSWGPCGRSGAEICEEHGCFENVLGSEAGVRSAASGAVLGRSWSLCWRS